MQRGADGDLQLHEQDVGGRDLRRERVDVLGSQRRERARHDHDPVVAARLDQDRRGHRRQRRPDHGTRVDALLVPEAERPLPEGVLTDGGQEGDVGAEPGRADRLVRSLAAVVAAEERADQRLTALRRSF